MNKEEKLKCGIICFLLFIIITSIVYCSMNKKEGLQNINTRTLLEKFDKL